jgi:acetyl esterase/lipase
MRRTPYRLLFLVHVLIALSTGTAFGQDKPAADAKYRIDNNIPYRSGDGLTDAMRERCRLDVYYPQNVKGYPTIVWFHGGGLTGGGKSIPAALMNKGVVVVAANYRLSPRAKAPEYVEDAAAAVAWTFANIEKYGGSRKHVFVSGHSAGGYLTSMVGLDKRWLRAHKINADEIAGLVPLSGQAVTHVTIRRERGIDARRPVIDDLAPLYHVRKDAAPLLLITGDRAKELLGRYEENAYLWRMMKEVGHPDVRLYELQGYDHGGMAGPAYPLLLRFVQEHTRKARTE